MAKFEAKIAKPDSVRGASPGSNPKKLTITPKTVSKTK